MAIAISILFTKKQKKLKETSKYINLLFVEFCNFHSICFLLLTIAASIGGRPSHKQGPNRPHLDPFLGKHV